MYGSNSLAVNPAMGFKTLQDLIDYAKKNPGKLSYASAGNGTSGHLAMELLKQRAGIDMLHVPYKAGGQALNDVIAGVVPLMFNNSDVVVPHLQTGRLSVLAITSPKRSPIAPNLPTVAEQGLPNFEVTAWAGVSVPSGTPKAIIDRLQVASARVVNSSAFKALQESRGGIVVGSTAEQFTAHVQREVDTWTQVIRTANIQVD
jgi:tripartite-type tricarboxylate transporter receptor subunit TctC